MEKRAEERARALEERQKAMEERRRAYEERRDKLVEEREKRREAFESRRNELVEKRRNKGVSEDILRLFSDKVAPSIFYFSSDGENKKFKVKKSIKVKMPKSVKLKMNVKHGEVKLASFTSDINASLRYASLLASTIDGNATDIRASYSPVWVQNWNYGQLKTDYSDQVNLKEVGVLRLNSNASNVTIDQLNKKAYLTNNLGALTINSVSSNFSDMDIVVKNGELLCKMPTTAFLVEVDETHSDLKYPSTLVVEKSQGFGKVVHSGYHMSKEAPKSIKINSKYSEVVLKD